MTKYRIVIGKSAEKELTKLPTQTILRIRDSVAALAENPRPSDCKKLKGFKDLWRIRVGSYRIIYSINDNILIIEVIKIGDRKDIYS